MTWPHYWDFFYKGHKFFIKIYFAELAVSYLVRHYSSATGISAFRNQDIDKLESKSQVPSPKSKPSQAKPSQSQIKKGKGTLDSGLSLKSLKSSQPTTPHHRVIHHVQGEHYKRNVLCFWVIVCSPVGNHELLLVASTFEAKNNTTLNILYP